MCLYQKLFELCYHFFVAVGTVCESIYVSLVDFEKKKKKFVSALHNFNPKVNDLNASLSTPTVIPIYVISKELACYLLYSFR